MKKSALVVCFGLFLYAGVALANGGAWYVMCNHKAHEGGRFVRVEQSFGKGEDAACGAAKRAHENNHGTGEQKFTVTCSWRNTPPK